MLSIHHCNMAQYGTNAINTVNLASQLAENLSWQVVKSIRQSNTVIPCSVIPGYCVVYIIRPC